MDPTCYTLAEGFIGSSYAKAAQQAQSRQEVLVRTLLAQRRLPQTGWSDLQIESLLNHFAAMDSNNFLGNIGVGEREGRVICPMVQRRHFHMTHGIGRSGDVAAVQPKAAGSSLMVQLTSCLVMHALKIAGMRGMAACRVFPLATGMTLCLALLTLRKQKPAAKFVIWPRIDQKSCFKCILTAGLTPIIIENLLEGEELRTDIEAIKEAISSNGPDSILCVLSTTSCFAPRSPDRVEDIALLCEEQNIGHVINNAYGVQSSKFVHMISEAARRGRVDAVVQSTDKNFMVPVGGAILCGPNEAFVNEVGKTYSGRASAAPTTDLFITLLHLGEEGWKKLLNERKISFQGVKDKLAAWAAARNLSVLNSPSNNISMALNIHPLGLSKDRETFIGSFLFSRCVSGARVVSVRGGPTDISGFTFQQWGSNGNTYPFSYLTVAVSVGAQAGHFDTFLRLLDEALAYKGKVGGVA